MISLKQRPISFLLAEQTAHISLKVRGTPSCRQAMYRQATDTASNDRWVSAAGSSACLKMVLAWLTIDAGALMRSAMVAIMAKPNISLRVVVSILRKEKWLGAVEEGINCHNNVCNPLVHTYAQSRWQKVV